MGYILLYMLIGVLIATTTSVLMKLLREKYDKESFIYRYDMEEAIFVIVLWPFLTVGAALVLVGYNIDKGIRYVSDRIVKAIRK